MSSVSPTSDSLFSVPLEHQWRIDFSGAMDVAKQRATGLDQFIGDDANRLLRYVTTDDFVSQLVEPDRLTSPVLTPIVFTGPSGTGKTSLAMALVSRLMVEIENRSEETLLPFDEFPLAKNEAVDVDSKPVYLTGSEFARRFYAAIDTDTVEEFRQSILQSAALLLDDVQQIANKAPAQRELESLLDQATDHHLPVFIVCNTSPAVVDGFSQRLVSRLSSGLIVPFHPPGAKARSRIARNLAEIYQVELTEDALELLNNQFEVTVPRLEHLFCQIKLKQRISQEDDVREVFSDSSTIDATLLQKILAPRDEDLQLMIRLIQKRVAKEYKLNVSDLKGNSRKQTVVLARGVGIYLIRVLLGSSFLKIGNAFGKRDHSTILHSFRKIESLYLSHTVNDNANLTSETQTCKALAEPRCSVDSTKSEGTQTTSDVDIEKHATRLTAEQKKTNGLIDRLKQELNDLFVTQISLD